MEMRIKEIAPGVWEVEEWNDDYRDTFIVWYNQKGWHCSGGPRSFKGFRCKHIRRIIEGEL